MCQTDKSPQMKISTPGNSPITTKIINILHGSRWWTLIGKMQHEQWTFLVFLATKTTMLYHAVRGSCDHPVIQVEKLSINITKNYTGEFLRAIQNIPDHLLPIGGVWLSLCAVKMVLGRDITMLSTIASTCKKWKMTRKKTYKKLFKDYPNVPKYSITYMQLTGYDILRQCGYI